MDTPTQLNPILTKLKLSGLLEHLPHRLRQASENNLGYSEFLFTIMQDELERRENRALGLRLKKSNLHPTKTMDNFDLHTNSKLPVSAIKELASCGFVDKGENIIIVGPSGAGKTHLAQAFGHECCRHGYAVIYERAADLLSWLHAGRADDSYQKRIQTLLKIPVLIIDDFGLAEFSSKEQGDFYEIVYGRHEQRPIIITSNRDIKEWFSLFQNTLLASAAIDRLMHRGVRLVVQENSHRLKDSLELNAKYGLTFEEK